MPPSDDKAAHEHEHEHEFVGRLGDAVHIDGVEDAYIARDGEHLEIYWTAARLAERGCEPVVRFDMRSDAVRAFVNEIIAAACTYAAEHDADGPTFVSA